MSMVLTRSFPTLHRYDYINTFETILADMCRSLPHLTSLTYARTGLDLVGSDIARFTNLRMLDLRDQSVISVAPEIGDSKTLQRTLRRLDISSNRLTTLPMSMGKLTALKVLEIRRNHMAELPPAVFELRGLEVLDAGNNALESLPPSFGDLLPNLKILRLTGSDHLREIPASFKKLTHLKFLDLRVSLRKGFNELYSAIVGDLSRVGAESGLSRFCFWMIQSLYFLMSIESDTRFVRFHS